MNSGIYKIEHIASGKIYVGSAVNFRIRWNDHKKSLRKNKHHNRKLQCAWNKYGEPAFAFSIIEHVHDKQRLIEREQFWIDELNAVASGYNIAPTAGSSLGVKYPFIPRKPLSQEHRAKISLMALNRDPEQVKKSVSAMWAARRKECSPETRAKIGAVHRGKIVSPETRAKISASCIGRRLSKETREKISAKSRSQIRGPLTPETRNKISAALKGGSIPHHVIEKRIATRLKNKASKVVPRSN